MSSSLRLLAAALPAMAVALDTSVIQEPGLIRFPVTATQGSSIFGTLAKRQVDTASFGARSGTLYTINVVLGTPGQTVPVQFDTGSSEMWVNPTCSQASNMAFCLAQPRFTYSNSLVDFGVTGAVTYPTGGYANFQYIGDFVRIGPATITQQIFAAVIAPKLVWWAFWVRLPTLVGGFHPIRLSSTAWPSKASQQPRLQHEPARF